MWGKGAISKNAPISYIHATLKFIYLIIFIDENDARTLVTLYVIIH